METSDRREGVATTGERKEFPCGGHQFSFLEYRILFTVCDVVEGLATGAVLMSYEDKLLGFHQATAHDHLIGDGSGEAATDREVFTQVSNSSKLCQSEVAIRDPFCDSLKEFQKEGFESRIATCDREHFDGS
ncbi:MAG: hypothetical protein HZA80_03475 [Candidatus Taylorbacteria bacterium]|nr:hypothetical protein [Candidatus Taylorbacteria bacterium]